MRSRHALVAAPAPALAAVCLLAAGCGGGAGSPGIASVASPPATATTGTSTTQSGSGAGDSGFGSAPGGGGSQFQIAMRVGNVADGAKFSACMRKHGLANFPDPNGQGVIEIHSGMGIDPGSPAFQSARSACQKVLPNGGQPTPQQQAQRQQQMLAFSKCMRAHGITDFPDPTNGGIRIHATPGSNLNPDDPQFQAAQKACQGNLPGLKGGPVSKPGG